MLRANLRARGWSVPHTQGIPDLLLDPEAGILREEVFRYWLSQEIARAVRYRDFFSVCLVGVTSRSGDGPSRGRAFVGAVSSALGERIRRTDPIGLVSEGLGILLLHVADEPAWAVAERLCTHVRQVAIPAGPQGLMGPITISVGGASFPRHGQTEAALLTHASQCLDVAQRRGGNRVVYDPTRP